MNGSDLNNLPDIWRSTMLKYGISARKIAIDAEVNLPHLYNVLNEKASPTLSYDAKIGKTISAIVSERESIPVETAGDSNETSRDTQQRIDNELSSKSLPPSQR